MGGARGSACGADRARPRTAGGRSWSCSCGQGQLRLELPDPRAPATRVDTPHTNRTTALPTLQVRRRIRLHGATHGCSDKVARANAEIDRQQSLAAWRVLRPREVKL